jgi:diguanylate cyclase (GGDEF)-like protein/PAS domain S-box-containing protein
MARDITESKLAEQALRDSEESLRESQMIAGLGSYVLDIQTGSWESSNILDQILGIDDEYERSEKGWDALIHPEDRAKAKNYLRRRFAAKCPTYDREYRIIRHSDKTERYIRGFGRLVLDNQGHLLQMHGTIQDVTDSRQELLAEKRAILGNQLIGIMTVRNRKIIWANTAFETMLGYGIAELTGAPTRQLYANEDGYQAVGAIYSNIENIGIAHTRQEFVRKDGRHIWVDMSATQLHQETKESLWVLIDVTERKQIENDLRIAATAFESQEGMLVTDVNNVILRVNQAFTTITGYTAEEVIGKTPSILNSGRQDALFYALMWESINNTGAWSGEIWNKRKNGDVYPEHLTITAVKDVNGIITNYVATLTDITERKQAEDEIEHLAFYDSLTHLPNRRLLLDRLNQALADSARSSQGGALLFLDLDHFKTLNDTLGHDFGDLLLQKVAERLIACVREGDTVARLGGDEFVVLLKDLSEHTFDAAAQTEIIAEKILLSLNQPYQLDMHEYHNSPSIGVTLYSGHDLVVDELLKQADIAMYQAKAKGRNTLRFFDPLMQDAINIRVDLERELRKALDKQQFHLYYQIQVGDAGRAMGAEALIRWIHPERGLVSPFHFIPLAEETGLILPIGQWVLDTACAQLKAWQQNAITRDLTLSINISAKQFHQVDFVDQVQTAVQRHTINPMHLKLELTESLLLDHIEDAVITMNVLKEMGIRFSLDDFGTGYSSLQYLKRLPLYQLKIDQSFIRDIAVDSSDQAIVRTIIAMAHTLNLTVIAEGVETEEQKGILLNNGCTHYQGYLFGKPVPIEQLETALLSRISQPN